MPALLNKLKGRAPPCSFGASEAVVYFAEIKNKVEVNGQFCSRSEQLVQVLLFHAVDKYAV